MKILLVNNGTRFLKELQKALREHNVKTVSLEKIPSKIANYDAVILSGGRFGVENHLKIYKKEINLIQNANIPILGICLGFQLIGKTFGEKLTKLDKDEEGIRTIKKKNKDIILKGMNSLKVYEHHKWSIKKTEFMKTIAVSKDGAEIIKHPSKKIYGIQFHPEIVENNDGWKVLENFLEEN